MQHQLLGVQNEALLALDDRPEPAESHSKQDSYDRELKEYIRHADDRSEFQLVYA